MARLMISIFLLFSLLCVFSNDSITDGIDMKVQEFYKELSLSALDQKIVTKNKGNSTTTLQPQGSTSDLTYEIRIKQLNKTTPVKLEFNSQVKYYIEIYTQRRKRDFENMLGLSELYFPIFEEKLDRYKLPLELKYLAIVESSLNPLAVSSSGAVGLWQFLYSTSKMFDLEVDSYIDQRCDPYISTEAACRYFTYLYNIFNDWQLAIAGFNGGPGEIRNAIEKSGGKTNFWEIQPYLPKQTRDYVPAFIACMYVMNYAGEHGIVKKSPQYNYFEVDTVKFKKAAYLSHISLELGMAPEQLRFLNPIYKSDYIPENENYSTLVLPQDKIVRFLRKQNKIHEHIATGQNYWDKLALRGDTIGKVKLVHNVEKGEFFHKIALKYSCSIEDLKIWNQLEGNHLYPGQVLFVWVPKEQSYLFVQQPGISQEDGYLIYTVQEGDTIWSIAEKFDLPSIQELKQLNGGLPENKLKPGQKLKINW
jgi:membrane-bound lytic murein transglycosylase D